MQPDQEFAGAVDRLVMSRYGLAGGFASGDILSPLVLQAHR